MPNLSIRRNPVAKMIRKADRKIRTKNFVHRTRRSVLPQLDGHVEKIIAAENSGNRGVYDVVQQFYGGGLPFDALVNDPPLGKIRSIDSFYHCIETDMVDNRITVAEDAGK